MAFVKPTCVSCNNLTGNAWNQPWRSKVAGDFKEKGPNIDLLFYSRDSGGKNWYICTGCGTLQTFDGKMAGTIEDDSPDGIKTPTKIRGAE